MRSIAFTMLPVVWWLSHDGSGGERTCRQTEMSDGPTPDDFRAKLFRDRKHTGDWRVEKLDEDGTSEIAIFSGPGARERAIRYADREYGAFDEIEVEPYRTD